MERPLERVRGLPVPRPRLRGLDEQGAEPALEQVGPPLSGTARRPARPAAAARGAGGTPCTCGPSRTSTGGCGPDPDGGPAGNARAAPPSRARLSPRPAAAGSARAPHRRGHWRSGPTTSASTATTDPATPRRGRSPRPARGHRAARRPWPAASAVPDAPRAVPAAPPTQKTTPTRRPHHPAQHSPRPAPRRPRPAQRGTPGSHGPSCGRGCAPGRRWSASGPAAAQAATRCRRVLARRRFREQSTRPRAGRASAHRAAPLPTRPAPRHRGAGSAP